MTPIKCRNPDCDYFNRTLPNGSQHCPWCGEDVHFRSSSAPAQQAAPSVRPQPPPAPAYSPPDPPRFTPAPIATPIPSPPRPPVERYPEPAPYHAPPAPRAAKPLLRLIHSSGRDLSLATETALIGCRRGTTRPELDLTDLPNAHVVSREHARISWDPNSQGYTLVDLNSRNGTFLNGSPLAPRQAYPLRNGDQVQLGRDDLVHFTVSIL
ncbi:FHA domain-containing protein [Anthocerotibacter panamensis]|uniref:FHA domain-containing protein n=1 Tax=Anthocerotibacter panamensis TaxID=2857077 RepID=UPI001C408C72|nr:FHA domain-containing protein [Anthocerotibacter panamensis]